MILWLLSTLFAVFLVHQFWYRRRHLPHGPTPLPFFGNFLSFAKENRWEDVFLKWKQRYGPVMTVWMGMKPMVFVTEHSTAHRLFVKEGETSLAADPSESSWRRASGGDNNAAFVLQTLRDFGMNKSQSQSRILDEVQYVIDRLNEDVRAGVKEVSLLAYTDIAIGSVVNSINKQEEFYQLKEQTTQILTNLANPLFRILVRSPSLHGFQWVQRKLEHAVKPQKEVFRFLDGIIQQHEEQNDYSAEMEPSDFIDAFLLERNRQEKSGEQHYFTHEQLRNVVFDMWFAGQETTSSTLTWGVAHLIRNLDAQKKLHDELDRVIGSDRSITMADKAALPYTNAVINEIQRCANILGLNLPRRCGRDVEIDGHRIPAGMTIVPQISVMHIDPEFSTGKEPPILRKLVGGPSTTIVPYKCRVTKRF
ncbi:(pine wood nematode) hypothetical protein [Aphelenchoides fujianensis]|nr:(pine wood nematode) hypothetical protein [Aphelenchoides fujianensis]